MEIETNTKGEAQAESLPKEADVSDEGRRNNKEFCEEGESKTLHSSRYFNQVR